MSSSPLVLGRSGAFALSRVTDCVRGLLERDAFSIIVIAIWTSLLLLTMPFLVGQDTFLAFVDGRLIAQHGLPHVDTLTYWTLGRPWIDQQWGAHLAFYELGRHGGLRLAAVVATACLAGALVAATVATRKLGASSRSAAIGLLLPLVGAPWLAQVRTQSLALVPFVLVYALLACDSRRPGRRVLLVLPVLVVWANLHGSVVLAAGLTGLYGLTLLRRSVARPRALLLVLGAPLCVLASPYGPDLIGYYRTMFVSAPLREFVSEWGTPTVGKGSAVFFISAFLLTALWARHLRVLTSFERWAIALLLIAAMTAVRNAIWFELAAAVTFPRLLDAAWPSRIAMTPRVRLVNTVLASMAVAVALVVAATQFTRPATWIEGDHTPAAAAAVAAAAGPHGIVLADEEHADWLLWQEPSLAGRVAYDVRFELFDRREMMAIRSLLVGSRQAWRRCGVTARVVTFAHPWTKQRIVQQAVLAPGARSILRGHGAGFSAMSQPASAGSCTRL
jgi:hypothetical protein